MFPHSGIDNDFTKLVEEVEELYDAYINNRPVALAIADCMIVLFGIADKSGIAYQELVASLNDKMDINEKRKWIEHEGTYTHQDL